MKTFLRYLCFLLIFVSHGVNSQTPVAFCRVGEHHDSLITNVPSYQKLYLKKKKEWNDWVTRQNSLRNSQQSNFTVPIVFHDLYSGTFGSVLNYQNVVNTLNQQFSGQNPLGQEQGIDTHIQFCLKTMDEAGQNYTGISTQHHSNIGSVNPYNLTQLTYINSVVAPFVFSKQKVCNIFIVDDFSITGMQGYSFLPYAVGLKKLLTKMVFLYVCSFYDKNIKFFIIGCYLLDIQN